MILIIVSPDGKYKDDNTYQTIVNYCTAPYKRALFYSPNLDRETAATEMAELATSKKKAFGTRIRHMILAFSPYEEMIYGRNMPIAALLIAKSACAFYQDRYQIITTVHRDTQHVHAHIVFNCVSYSTGTKYPGDKRDYYLFQKHLKKVVKGFSPISYDGAFYSTTENIDEDQEI